MEVTTGHWATGPAQPQLGEPPGVLSATASAAKAEAAHEAPRTKPMQPELADTEFDEDPGSPEPYELVRSTRKTYPVPRPRTPDESNDEKTVASDAVDTMRH